MKHNEVILRGRAIVEASGHKLSPLDVANFLDFSDRIRDGLREWPAKKREATVWLRDFAETLRAMRDDFDTIVRRDPMVLYTPQHAVALAFHKSLARTRYARYANRSSKTQGGIADDYWVMTYQHPWRPRPPVPAQVLIVGTNFTKYRVHTFEPKWLFGEPGNPLSPVFPELGKWFYSYDKKSYKLEIACPACAESGRNGMCHHERSSLILFSDTEGPGVMAGCQAAQVHLDEQVQYDIYRESVERTKTVPNSGVIVTETPILGEGFWTHTTLTRLAESGECLPGSTTPLATIHKIDQFSAGLVNHDEIRASMATMSEAEIQTRIYGIPAVSSDIAVFDLGVLAAMAREDTAPAKQGRIEIVRDKDQRSLTDEELLQTARWDDNWHVTLPLRFDKEEDGPLAIWEKPIRGEQYVIGVDTAKGLTKRDASCASVLKMTPTGTDIYFELVAQYHAWLDPLLYAAEVYKLGLMYQPATIAVETNGPGDVVVKRLKDLGCWFLFMDMGQLGIQDRLDQMYGIDTNQRTKSVLISMLQGLFKMRKIGRRAIVIPCKDTLSELRAYVQQPTETGRSFRFEAAGGHHDDRVMSLAIAAYAARAYPIFDFDWKNKIKDKDDPTDKRDARSRRMWKQLHEEMAEKERQRQENLVLEEQEEGWPL